MVYFTFLTSTSPALDEGDIKQMRAHVTRKNFEKRREHLEGRSTTSSIKSGRAGRTQNRQLETSDKLRLGRKTERGQQYGVSPYQSMIPMEANYAAIHQCKILFFFYWRLLLSNFGF